MPPPEGTDGLRRDRLGGVLEVVGVLLERRHGELGRLPERRLEVAVRLAQGEEDRLDEVAHRAGVAARRGVAVVEAGHGEELLRGRGGDEAGTARGRDEAHADRAALAGELLRHGVRGAGVLAPVAEADRDEVHLGRDDAAADRGGDLLGALVAEADVALLVTDDHVGLEAEALASRGLLRHRLDAHDLVLEGLAAEEIDDLVLGNAHREEEDVLEGLDLALLAKAAELGARHPLVLVVASASASASAATATVTASAVAASAVAASAVAASPAEATTLSSCVSHYDSIDCWA
eukprot:CAMPEP_0119500684 /NCGR_PEP_ID=MMETSP1344-20130328/22750_1 /TAXON_ID=236787 /ORGANISM="Florenciella parvula, Strain CCMP2471" /LENGTH=291 /DNA_ID=CAMNT_0007536793 /DNA_START=334 /DNA_END=1210 /DNA_ORIENTATION=-